jgi:ribosomal protein S18 acetylase RimI-like enzyme
VQGNNVQIRLLSVTDEPLLAAVPQEFGVGRVPEGRAARLLSNPANLWIAAVEDGQVVGLLIGYEIPLLDKTEMLLFSIDTKAGYRRRGIGRGMVDLMREVCAARGIVSIWIPTNEGNSGAMAFYRSLGATRKANDNVVWELEVDPL